MKYELDQKASGRTWLGKLLGNKCASCLNRVECRLMRGCQPEEANAFEALKSVMLRVWREEYIDLKLILHPFSVTGGLYSMDKKGGYYGLEGYHHGVELAQWQKELADALWDEIPGMMCLFFQNGHIQIRHTGCFSNEELEPIARQVIKPFLKRELKAIKKIGEWDWNKRPD